MNSTFDRVNGFDPPGAFRADDASSRRARNSTIDNDYRAELRDRSARKRLSLRRRSAPAGRPTGRKSAAP